MKLIFPNVAQRFRKFSKPPIDFTGFAASDRSKIGEKFQTWVRTKMKRKSADFLDPKKHWFKRKIYLYWLYTAFSSIKHLKTYIAEILFFT